MPTFLKNNKFTLLVLLGLIVLNLGLFSFNLNNFFLSDDFDWLSLTKNSAHNLGDYFSANYYGERGVGGSYRPLVNLMFWLNYQIGGLNPLPYHLTSLFFHIGVCFLIYLLILILFEGSREKRKIAILAAVLFSLLPNHSEAVIWISAIADPMATFFYLLAFYLYLLFRKNKKLYFVLLSTLFFVFALLTKELAITLPFLILAWEIFEAQANKLFKFKDIILRTLAYWLILIGYFVLRYLSIGLVFGYYAQEKFKFDFFQIFKMFVSLITDLFFFGRLRVSLTDFFISNDLVFVFLFVILLLCLWSALKGYKLKVSFLLTSFFILILPVLLLSFNNFNDEGERYNYLPSVIFCLLLSLLIVSVKNKHISWLVFSLITVYFATFLINKNLTWNLASQISEQIIIKDIPRVAEVDKAEKLLFVSLPDNLAGAQVLRNGILQAINLFYPQNNWQVELLNAYVRTSWQNYNKQILAWSAYPTGGYIAKTIDGKSWTTGFDRRETADYVFELWNYNYDDYTSDTIRLILKDEKIKILIFDQGELRILKK
ncbi:MAG: hypothetical protein PHC97_02240 [Patescibacteria group bacterium]|nr:hypothetical protein [Patescibacteria group bacterium]